MAQDIFSGDVVKECDLPKKDFHGAWDRREWGVQLLREYVGKTHGRDITVHDNGNLQGRLTGIKAFVSVDNNVITYALIEPRDKWDRRILIVRTESARDECMYSDAHIITPSAPETFANAFARSNIDLQQLRESLPSEDDIMIVEINRHPKTKKPGIAPQYLDADPILDGQKSMRVFHPVFVKGELQIGQKWRCRKVSDPVVAGKNKLDVPMVHINVALTGTVSA